MCSDISRFPTHHAAAAAAHVDTPNSIIFIWRSFWWLYVFGGMCVCLCRRPHNGCYDGMAHMKMALIYLIAYWFYCVSLHLGCSHRLIANKQQSAFSILWNASGACMSMWRSLVVNLSATKLLHRQPHLSHISPRTTNTVTDSCFCPNSNFYDGTQHFTIVRPLSAAAAAVCAVVVVVHSIVYSTKWKLLSAYALLLQLLQNKERNKYLKSLPSSSRPYIQYS